MNITSLIELLPESVKLDTMNFEDVMLKDGRPAMRVTMCRLLTEDELAVMSGKKHFLGLHLITHHKYAPEIRKSYFYVV